MFIDVEPTPNPETLKFLPDQQVMPSGSVEFRNPADAGSSPLAMQLFADPGVAAVFLGEGFVSITKTEDTDWDDLRPRMLGALMQFFARGIPVIDGDQIDGDQVATSLMVDEKAEDADIIAQIRGLLDEKIRPAVAQDGGDILYQGYRDGIVYLGLQGACAGCPSSSMTLKHGIENLLRYYVPEVTEVRNSAEI